MNVLITGVAGFLGSHLCDRFLNEGHSVIGVDSFITGSLENLPKSRYFKFYNRRIQDWNFWQLKHSLDLVLNFASPASPVAYYNDPLYTLETGSEGTKNVMELAGYHNAKILVASTSEIYGEPAVHPQPESYYGNVNPIGLRSCYDEAKRFQEALTMAYHREYNVDTRIIRIFNTYGPRMAKNDGRVIPNFINQALNNEPITIYGDGLQTRSFCYVDDLIDGIMLSIEKGDSMPMNLGNPVETNMLELAEIIIELTNSKSKLVHQEIYKDDPTRRCPDITKARAIGFEPKVSLIEGLKKMIEWKQ